ncbi:universal stress protein [Amycolatopsis cihanbeyliensis]|uniref:Nucleotide-binding universal stress UspA family protein n=1 Tax=Amycolatopsis cihanbeyliensis TaxID=1128664 RepID=A0A542DQ20_AMYCI|nr:universal stress protein [Amycolatopsis cihanbeyliensis]TQJ05201.1 nucleotide-binding universal stress UspA family protein [Amycolatopsis cihanbeyliensis]
MVDGASRPVMVGVDGSTSATHAVRWAAHEAARRQVPLLIVHVCALVPVAVPHAAALGAYKDALVEQGRQWLAEAAAAARESAPDVAVDTELDTGSAPENLIGRSTRTELVVLGSRGLGGFTGLVVGSIAVAVATHGHCPVVVVRGADPEAAPRQNGPVVVGVDGSPTSQAAISFAFHAASARSVPVVAVHAWSDLPIATAWEATAGWQSDQHEESKVLSEWLAECQARYPDVPVECVVARDRPAHALLDHAKSAQLVVVGSRGRGGFRGLLLGSTSQALIHHAACPVAVVPPRP